MPKDIMTAWTDYPVPQEDGRGSDMSGPGETPAAGSPGAIMEAFDQAVTPKSGTSETGGRMKTTRFANTPSPDSPHIQTSVALNLTGKAKAK